MPACQVEEFKVRRAECWHHIIAYSQDLHLWLTSRQLVSDSVRRIFSNR